MRTGEEEKELPPTFALAAKRVRAFDLSCRACGVCGAGAGCWAWIPGWETFGFHPQPPISGVGWLISPVTRVITALVGVVSALLSY